MTRLGSMNCPHCKQWHRSSEFCACEGATAALMKPYEDALAKAKEPAKLKAAIAVDDWKLPIFRKRLTEAGYIYQDAGAFTGDTTILTVETDNMLKLKKVIEQCQAECTSSQPER